MPQLDTLTFPSQLFWLGICFVALYLMMSYFLLPKITRVLQKREESLEETINQASLYREQAEDLLADYESILAQAREHAQQHTKSVAHTAAEHVAKQQKEFLEKLSDRLHLAEQDLFRARVESGKEIETLARDVANALLDKITGSAEKGEGIPHV